MLAEALKFLRDAALAAADPKPLDVPDPRARHFVVNGQAVRFEAEVPPRKHAVGTLDDLVALANRFGAEEAEPISAVWYERDAVVLVIDDDAHRVETATLALAPADAFSAVVRAHDARTRFAHKDFVRFLRIDLAGALPPEALLNVVRKVKFENGTAVRSDAGRTKESLGREITASVSAEKDIPETVTLSLPVYKTPGETEPYPLRCAVEVDPMEGFFRLVPLPDEVERVRQLALCSVADRLRAGLDTSVPAYQGRP